MFSEEARSPRCQRSSYSSLLFFALFAFFFCGFVVSGGETSFKVLETVGEDFDVEKYVSKPWFVQEQNVNRYQPLENLFSLRAQYRITSDFTLDVFNFARIGSVTGPPANPRPTIFKASILDKNIP